VLHRGRVPDLRVPLHVAHTRGTLTLRLRPGWLKRHPLTRGDLEREAEYLMPTGIKLKFS